MKPEISSPKSPVESSPLSGIDPVVDHLLKLGLPVTRENWIKAAGLEEPLEAEHEAMLDEALSLMSSGSSSDPMQEAVSQVEAWGGNKVPAQ